MTVCVSVDVNVNINDVNDIADVLKKTSNDY